MEYLALIAEIEELKARLAKWEKPPPAPRVPCGHKTAKGEVCKRFCVEGSGACKVHSRPPKVPKVVRKARAPKVACTGINIRGNPCKRKVLPDCTYCERHDPTRPPRVSKAAKKKGKGAAPTHNHGPGEVGELCKLCETHGDVMSQGPFGPWKSEMQYVSDTLEIIKNT